MFNVFKGTPHKLAWLVPERAASAIPYTKLTATFGPKEGAIIRYTHTHIYAHFLSHTHTHTRARAHTCTNITFGLREGGIMIPGGGLGSRPKII